MHEQRLLAYIDILGWTKASASPDLDSVQLALSIIHRHCEVYSEHARKALLAPAASHPKPNPFFMEVQFGAFSDHFVFSKPTAFGGRIFSVGKICVDLLEIGFLTRGAIVLGDLYHRDNVIFGSALIEAVRIEETEAFFPRIVIADNVLQHCEKLGHLGTLKHHFVIDDQFGRPTLNIFSLPEYGQDTDLDMSMASLNIPMKRIWETINTKIQMYGYPEYHRYREKWIYLKEVIERKVFPIYPALKSLVEDHCD